MINTKRFHQKLGSSSGFTLIEIMVAFVIVAVIGLVAAPLVENFGPNMRIKGASRDLHTTLERMKVEAIKRNEHVAITLNPVACPPPPTGGTFTLFVDEDRDGTFDAGEDQLLMDDQSEDPAPDFDYDMPRNTTLCINASLPATTTFRFSNRGMWLDAAGNPLGGDTVFLLQNDATTSRRYQTTVSVAGGISTVKLP